MGDAEKKPMLAGEPFGSSRVEQEENRNWTPMIVGAVLVVVAIALIVVFTRNKPVSNTPDPYAANVQISDVHMATAQNFAGGSVTYIEGTLSNTGTKKITGARVQVTFRNSLNEIVDDPVLPVMALQPDTPIVDYGPMDRAPIGPGQKRDFRITMEHISADWNGQVPQIKVVGVSTN
ncbi:MAG TPA: hypothetical protein VJA94_04580 [Candidatus Angelobacter sp.]